MLIDVTPILRGETDRIGIDSRIDPPQDFDDITFTGEINVTGGIKDMSGYTTLDITASIPFRTHCARCWKEISRTFKLDFSKRITGKNVHKYYFLILFQNNIYLMISLYSV